MQNEIQTSSELDNALDGLMVSSELDEALAELKTLGFNYNDGGRKEAGYKGDAGDCVTRAISIATGNGYEVTRKDLMRVTEGFKGKSRSKVAKRVKSNSVRNGVFKEIYRPYLEAIGWKRVGLQKFGDPKRYYMTTDDLPMGTVIVEMRKHLVTVIDHVVKDTWDSRVSQKWVDGAPTDETTPKAITAYWVSA